ncbi:MAG TPA: AIR synthase-related protein, partial [Rubrivivax sp.]|nr:AIR synthase-related protein [Rubrivivax sp.]
VVEKDTPGFTATKILHKAALRGVPNADIVLQDVRVPVANKLANCRSFKDVANVLKTTRAGVAWGAGETPALAGIVEAGRIDLAASCTGIVNPKSRLTLGERLGPGDAIVLLASSGIHANGLSLARKLADRLPAGYLSPLPDGTRFGDALLAPTVLYSPVTEALAEAGIVPHYSANITGHAPCG